MLIGIIGITNKGKSTFFKAATLMDVHIENRPFVTIKPNHGSGFIKVDCVDKEFNVKCNPKAGYCIENKRFVPIDLLDVAGLVPEAHKGYGLGLEFLNDLNQADALINIIDISGTTNEKGEITNNYDPTNDIKFLENELDHWYLGILKRAWDKLVRTQQQEQIELSKAIAKQFSGLNATEIIVERILNKLNFKKNLVDWDNEEIEKFSVMLRKETKPMIIAANKVDIDKNNNYEKIKKEFKDYIVIPCSSESELALKEAAKHNLIKYIPGNNNFEIVGNLSEKQKEALSYIKKNVLDKYGSTGVQEVLNQSVFSLLKKIIVFPVANNKLEDKKGNKLPDALIVDSDITALDFAFKVHTDIGNNFIKAVNLKTKQIVGKDNILKNRDVIEIITK